MSINPLDLTGRTVLVTGASGGLGRAVARGLAQLGARLVLSGRSAERLAETQRVLAAGDHLVAPYDLNELGGLSAWLGGVVGQTGPLWGVVHCTGIDVVRALRFLSDDDVAATLQTNVQTAFALARAWRQRARYQQGGGLVLLSSAAGLAGQAGQTAYSASKAALIGFARSLALEWARDGLRVNCVAPGVVEAGIGAELRSSLGEDGFSAVAAQHPLGLGTGEDVAWAVAYLLADTGRWVTGTVLTIDGGLTA